jgi:hypothetical protein
MHSSLYLYVKRVSSEKERGIPPREVEAILYWYWREHGGHDPDYDFYMRYGEGKKEQ